MIVVTVLHKGVEAFRCEKDSVDGEARWTCHRDFDGQMLDCRHQGAYNPGGPQEVFDAYAWTCAANGDLGFICEDNDKGPWSMTVTGWEPEPAGPDFEPEGVVY